MECTNCLLSDRCAVVIFGVFCNSLLVVLCCAYSVLDAHSSAGMMEPGFALRPVCLKALGGFLLIMTDDGEVIYISENVQEYLGIVQVCRFSGICCKGPSSPEIPKIAKVF